MEKYPWTALSLSQDNFRLSKDKGRFQKTGIVQPSRFDIQRESFPLLSVNIQPVTFKNPTVQFHGTALACLICFDSKWPQRVSTALVMIYDDLYKYGSVRFVDLMQKQPKCGLIFLAARCAGGVGKSEFGDPKFGSVSRFQLPANNSPPGATQCDSGVKVHANANMWVVCNLDASRLSWSPTIPWLHVAVSQWISACHRIFATVSFQWLRLEWGNMLQDVARHAAVLQYVAVRGLILPVLWSCTSKAAACIVTLYAICSDFPTCISQSRASKRLRS